MSVTYSRIVFPFRVISFFTLYIVINTILYNRIQYVMGYLGERIKNTVVLHPLVPRRLENITYINGTHYPPWNDLNSSVQAWIIAGDVFIVLLFFAMVFGFLLTVAHVSFLIAMLHFVAVVLLTHFYCEYGHIGFLITAVWIGVIAPFLIEVWRIVQLFVFKADFYYVPE